MSFYFIISVAFNQKYANYISNILRLKYINKKDNVFNVINLLCN